MQFQDKVLSLQEIVTGAEGIEASQIGSAHPTEMSIATMSTYKKNNRPEKKKLAEQRAESNIYCYNCDEAGHLGHHCEKLNQYTRATSARTVVR